MTVHRDDTYSIMLEEQALNPKEITTICLTRNFGLEGAVKAGIRQAKGDAVVVMDADLQGSAPSDSGNDSKMGKWCGCCCGKPD